MTENVNLNVNLTEDSCVFIDLAPAYTSYMEHEIIKTVAKTLLVLENQEDLYHAESRRWR